MVDRFEELRTYIAIVETGGVNAAAAKMGIARSAVSRRLSELEARLGVTLVERTTRRFELTGAGQRYYAQSKRVMGELDRIDAAVGGLGEDAITIVVEISPDHVGVIANALADFLTANPGTTLDIVSRAGHGGSDIAISTTDHAKGRPVGGLDPIVVCAPSYVEKRGAPEGPSDLGDHIAIVIDGAHGAWTFKSGVEVAPRAVVKTDSASSALSLAIAAAGVAQLPRTMCAPAIEAGMLTEVLSDAQPKQQPLFAHIRDGSSAADALLDHIVRSGSQKPA